MRAVLVRAGVASAYRLSETITTLKVTWPSGKKAMWNNLPADGIVNLVKDQPGLYTRHGEMKSLPLP